MFHSITFAGMTFFLEKQHSSMLNWGRGGQYLTEFWLLDAVLLFVILNLLAAVIWAVFCLTKLSNIRHRSNLPVFIRKNCLRILLSNKNKNKNNKKQQKQ